jgi:hypothetical protein
LVRTNRTHPTVNPLPNLLIVTQKKMNLYIRTFLRQEDLLLSSRRYKLVFQTELAKKSKKQSQKAIKTDFKLTRKASWRKWLLRTSSIWETPSLWLNLQKTFLLIWDFKKKDFNYNQIISRKFSYQQKWRIPQEHFLLNGLLMCTGSLD